MDDLASTQEATVEAFLHAFEQMDYRERERNVSDSVTTSG
jgi:limonene-1,2-epoxide hydrolase